MLFMPSRRATLSAARLALSWSAISVASPATVGSNEDRAITWAGSSRTVTAEYGGGGAVQYRIDSGSWINYTAGFALASGQTVAWRIGFSGDESGVVFVYVNGRSLSSFETFASGFDA